MSILLGIDPGDKQSAYALINIETCNFLEVGKVDNDAIRWQAKEAHAHLMPVAIEMIASYGMLVGREVFETVLEIGRLVEITEGKATLVYRKEVTRHFCHSTRAGDSNIIRALVDIFAPGRPNFGKGTKAEPGWFYGFAGDIWQAYAVAVYAADQRLGVQR